MFSFSPFNIYEIYKRYCQPSETEKPAENKTNATLLSKKYDVIISGSGPAGLATAYEFTQLGYSVLIIDSHEEFIRPQLVFLASTSKDYLKKMVAASPTHAQDALFINKMKVTSKYYNSEHYNIKDIERFIKRRLEDKKDCHFLTRATISKIDMKKGVVEVESKSKPTQSFQFTHLIGADGAKHPTADKLKEKDYDTGYHPIPSHKRKYHLTAYFTIKSRSDKLISHLTDIAVNAKAIDRDNYAYFYTEKSSHEKSNGKKMKACLTMTLPEDVYKKWKKDLKNSKLSEDTDKKMKLEVKRIIQKFYYPECDVEFTKSRKYKKAKDKLKIQLFKAKLFEANKAAILVNDHIYARVGDALRSPDFYLGHGVRLGFEEAEALVKQLHGQSKADAIDVYHAFYRRLSNEAIIDSEEQEKDIERSLEGFIFHKLIAALYDKDMSFIQNLLQDPLFDPNQIMTGEGSTSFHAVVTCGNLKALDAFLNHPNIDMNRADKKGNTPLHYIVLYAELLKIDMEILRALLKNNKVKLHQKNNENCTPLQLAMATLDNDSQLVKELRDAILQEIKILIRDTPFRTTSWETQTGSLIEFDGQSKPVPRPISAIWNLIKEVESGSRTNNSAFEEIIRIGNENALQGRVSMKHFSGMAMNRDQVTQEFYEKFTTNGEYTAKKILGRYIPIISDDVSFNRWLS